MQNMVGIVPNAVKKFSAIVLSAQNEVSFGTVLLLATIRH